MKIGHLAVFGWAFISFAFMAKASPPQSASAWIEQLQKAPVDAALEDLRLGCYYRVTTRAIVLSKLEPEKVALLKKYDDWVLSSGNALVDKWASKQPLSPEELPYLSILKATYMHRAWGSGQPRKSQGSPEDIFIESSMNIGKELMKKGFFGEPLSEEDVEGLRNYHMLSAMVLTNFKLLPCEFGLADKTAKGTQNGEKAPDFTALPMEAITKQPHYTDALQQDVTAFLKPQGVIKFLMIFEGYETVESQGKKVCIPIKPALPAGVTPKDLVKLSDLKDKPTVFVLAYPPDVFWKVIAAPFEALNHLYKDRAHFIHMNINYHDSYATGPVYFGPDAGNEMVKLIHPVTWEQKARMSRAVALCFPNITYHLFMDDMAQTIRNAYRSEGGSGQCVIVGKNGEITFDPGKGWVYWTKASYTDSVVWLNETEIALRHTLGLPAAELPASRSQTIATHRPSKRKAFEKREAKPYGYGNPNNYGLWLTGHLEKIESGNMVVVPTLPPEDQMKGWCIRKKTPDLKLGKFAQRNFDALEKWMQDAKTKTHYLFKIEDGVELFINGEEAELDAFKPGDTVAVWYDVDQDAKAGVKPVHVRTSRF